MPDRPAVHPAAPDPGIQPEPRPSASEHPVTRPPKAGSSGRKLSHESIVALLTLGLLIVGGLAHIIAGADVARRIGSVGLWFVGAPLVWTTLRNAARGKFATDIVASLSIIGAVALNQPLAGLVIVLMQSGGEGLERFAEGRASAAVRALEEAAPRMAHLIAASTSRTFRSTRLRSMIMCSFGRAISCRPTAR